MSRSIFTGKSRPFLIGLACFFLLSSCSLSKFLNVASTTGIVSGATASASVEDSQRSLPRGFILLLGFYRGEGPGIFILDLRENRVSRVSSSLAATARWASLSKDGEEVLFESQGDIFGAELRTGVVKPIINDPSLDEKPVGSPIDNRFAFETNNGGSICLSDYGGNVEALVPARTDAMFDLGNWSPDGKEIIYTELLIGPSQEGIPIVPDYLIMIVDLESGQSRPLFDPSQALGMSKPANPVFSPDGRAIAFQGILDEHSRIFISDSDGNNIRQLTSETGDYSNPVWSPDGRNVLAFTGGEVENTYSIFTIDGVLTQSIVGLDGLVTEWVLPIENN